ncbi:polysaccharide export protein [Erythrobacter arachoides]|uniref:Polysaccharide export protein n=1 Tax=Aurantiacibacter arachoides TaxID=1850444 RepID=A0A844ZYL9_9SPHN|nr:polysaccharide biosynthesis/export family protein [Aurantiacibacter arachoides]MXO93253.1 polysaccharide export protein [Aurantiacibacter arachoides]GGD50757.1 GumB protein [Aurantiacibacter arachoides]
MIKKFNKMIFFAAAVISLPSLSGCTSGPSIEQTRAQLTLPADMPTTVDRPYRIGASDVLQINVFDEPALSLDEITVDSSGTIPFPLVGDVQVAGRTGREVATEIQDRLGAEYLRNPQVSVFVTNSARLRLTVEGDVETPGVFEIKGDTSLLQAIALAGGPTQTANLEEIIVFRHVDQAVYAAQFDLRDVRMGIEPNVPLEAGDIVVVSASGVKGLLRDALQVAPLLTALFYRII